ncbi:flagellar basal-body rod protein FlgG [Candidatus Koribacter versatilis Ellin345]|uniref:Flagellar basal-body rod protein FlgG n=1 Tax=Koribacter versatilis (strain Ellin345) TaxID=204669 RepID=Q1IMH7_KORVE|nr:flagellar basal-body rod protein FlgF [Candidatus Koribacter versatilis]ABF41923.1 flagellar basal-body rod protein FlgG [Candidatus Koribacter versatilis Ellin345]
MDTGSYVACAGLVARSQQLDLAAQDLANINTSGYRSQRSAFRAVLAKSAGANLTGWSAAVNNFGTLGETRLSRTPGNLEKTGNPLDLGLEGDGFFVVQTPAGPRYTRRGNFQISSAGALETSDGYPVQGSLGTVRVPNGELAISADGTLSVDGAIAGKLKVVQFAPSTQLQAESGSYYSAPAGRESPAANTSVRQGMIESSNVNAIASSIQLVTLQRTAEMLQRALTTFHSEFDRTAVEDLPKV